MTGGSAEVRSRLYNGNIRASPVGDAAGDQVSLSSASNLFLGW
jgi:hypothetical protein